MILDGNLVAGKIREQIRREVEETGGRKPGLAVVIAKDDPRSRVYVRSKERAAKKAGFHSRVVEIPGGSKPGNLRGEIEELNRDDSIDGILVQIPLPGEYDEGEIISLISPQKDVDGLHPFNLGRLVRGEKGHVPCTPNGIIRLMDEYGIEIKSKRVLIVGRSNIVGKPLFHLFLRRDATVTVAHTRTLGLDRLMLEAEILVSAVGKPFIIKKGMVKKGAILVDVGINTLSRDEYGRFREIDEDREREFEKKGYTIVGDMDYDGLFEDAGYITPVPGGVGPLTVAMLLENTLDSYRERTAIS